MAIQLPMYNSKMSKISRDLNLLLHFFSEWVVVKGDGPASASLKYK
jgi:hypothetical protein